MAATLEQVLDNIAIALIESQYYGTQEQVQANQKTVRDGIIQVGRQSSDEKLIIYQKDTEANEQDLLTSIESSDETITLNDIVTNIGEDEYSISINELSGVITLSTTNPTSSYYGGIAITDLLQDDVNNPINLGQFISISNQSENIDVNQANEFLDTNIFELLGDDTTRQERINEFFTEFQNLTQDPPTFVDNDGDGLLDIATEYDGLNDITDDNPFDNTKSIVRLEDNEGGNNTNQSLESLRDTLNTYLVDIDQEATPPPDDRPEYVNQSSGFLKFRQLNQGIIIRNVDSEFVEGLNPNTQEYLTTGFTITMWVRFLDKKSEGTLFNFGNPTRETNPLGFKLDTLVDDENRYLRLLVHDGIGTAGQNPAGDGVPYWYDSHMGMSPSNGVNLDKIETDSLSDLSSIDIRQYTPIPMDFNEWFFICATYNPSIDERGSTPTIYDEDFWRNNIENADGSGNYTSNSDFGNRSKIEIISRTDLLTARGYRV
tara:strand:+ start:456 stop:1919 length:1464 start_codon:yes stop_codon:yes gene_type:complete